MKPNRNVVESEALPRQPRPATQVPPNEARAELTRLDNYRSAAIQPGITAADERVKAAQAEVARLEAAVAASKASADAALLAGNREAYRTAKFDIDFDEQQLAAARTALTAAQEAGVAASAPLAAVQAERESLINLVLRHEAELHMDRLIAGLDELLSEARQFNATLTYFIRQRTPGPFIEQLGQMRQRLRPYVVILDTPNADPTDVAEVAELVNRL